MKNQFLFKILLIILIASKSFAQNKSVGSLNYNIISSSSGGTIINCVLYFNEFSCISYNQQVNSIVESTASHVQNVTQPDSPTSNYQYKNQKDNILLSAQRGNKVIKEELYPINWKITKEKKVILGFNCIKAIGTLRGRTYDTWFCPKISSNLGPWKFYGLPGLILEAKSTDNEIEIVPVKINMNDKAYVIEIPKLNKKDKIVSYNEYAKEYHERRKKLSKPKTKQFGKDSFIKVTTDVSQKGLEFFPTN